MNDVSQPAGKPQPGSPDASHTHDAPFDFDVAIVGAGPVGLALAGWLARRSATQALSIALIDARKPEDALGDPRAIAVSQGSRMILEPLRWPADATAIHRIHVSQRGHFGRTLIDHTEHGLPALGYVLRYGSIVQALAEAVRPTSVHWLQSTSAQTPVQEHDGVTLPVETAQGPRNLRTRILVNAEGGLFHEQQKSTSAGGTRDYGQTALVGTVSVSAPRPHVAWERFTEQGPIALLPTGGARDADYALVWCCSPGRRHAAPSCPTTRFCANSARRSATAWAASRDQGPRLLPARSERARYARQGTHGGDRQCGADAASGGRPRTESGTARRACARRRALAARRNTARARRVRATPCARPAPDDSLNRYARAPLHRRLPRRSPRCADSR